MSEKMFNLIKDELASIIDVNEEVEKAVWLIFTIGKKLYALPSNDVKEILRDSSVYPLPFVPPYINGVLNRYGDPYAVIDPAVVINEEPQKTSLFLVLNSQNNTCFRITDVKEFYTAPVDELTKFSETEMSAFFEGTITYSNENVLVMKSAAFLEKAGNDLASN